jgi:hypothetical protein
MKKYLPLLQAFALVLLAVPATTLAVEQYPPIICTGLFGCGGGAENVILQHTFPTAATLLIQIAGGGAVIAIVVAGVQMVASYGDEGKFGNARKGIMFALGGLALVLSAAPIVSFITTEEYGFQGNDGSVLTVMATALRIIMALFNVGLAIIVILAGLRMVLAQGNADEFKKGGTVIKYAIIGAVVVNLARTLVQALLTLYA